MLKWSNADYMKNNNTTEALTSLITKGPNQRNRSHSLVRTKDVFRQPYIPEPIFIADLNHRKKVLTGELYQLANVLKSLFAAP
jgi:hypothetical protein